MPFGSSAWTRKGETMSLTRACALYDVTEQQVRDAEPPIECQWRSYHGNPYAVVKCSDMCDLKRQIDRKERDKKEQELITELGKEGYEKMKAEEEAKEEAERARARAEGQRKAIKEKLGKMLQALLKFSSNEVAKSLDGIVLAKTNVKKEWYLQDSDLDGLPVEKVGRSMKYKLHNVIARAEEKHGSVFPEDTRPSGYWNRSRDGTLMLKIQGYPERVEQYVRYLQEVFHTECRRHPDDVVQEAYEDARAVIQRSIDAKAAQIRQAEQELQKEESRLRSFDGLMDMLKAAPAGRE